MWRIYLLKILGYEVAPVSALFFVIFTQKERDVLLLS